MKIGTKIIATNSSYKPDVPNGTIMTVTHVFENNDVDATVDGGDGFNWYMTKGTFEEHTPALPYGHVTLPDGRTVDLTANRVRVDLMDPDKLQAMQDHGGPWDIRLKNKWKAIEKPSWNPDCTYRVAHKPVVRTEIMYTNINTDSLWGLSADSCPDDRTHKITLTIKDGDIIDTKTEKL